jgi:hypothetical protein
MRGREEAASVDSLALFSSFSHTTCGMLLLWISVIQRNKAQMTGDSHGTCMAEVVMDQGVTNKTGVWHESFIILPCQDPFFF